MIEKVDKKEDLSQISLTGVRSLVLLGLLIQEPRSLEDIRREFMSLNILEGSNSDDILRIDINTLRSMGCVISRADHRTNNKYVLLDHPFKLNITKDEVEIVRKTYNKIKDNADLNVIQCYNELFNKIAQHISDKDAKEALLSIAPLKGYNLNILNDLKKACKNKRLVKLEYKSPTSNKTDIEIVAEKVVMQNNKFYLYGVDKNSKQSIDLKVKRILKIISQSSNDDNLSSKPVVIKFLLKELGLPGLEDYENIIEGDVENGFVIEGKYHNEFFALQRILSFGTKCIVIEPSDFKNKVVDTLTKMKEIYND